MIRLAACLLSAFLVFATSTAARAEAFTIFVHPDMLNRVAAAAGPQNFSGNYDYTAPPWLGGHLIARINWRARIENVNFTISTHGIRYTALVHMRFRSGGFLDVSRSQTVAGAASFAIVGNEMRFRMTTLRVPLVVNLPGAGPITVHTITTTLPYELSYRFQPHFALRAGSDGGVEGRVHGLQRAYRPNRVEITGNSQFW